MISCVCQQLHRRGCHHPSTIREAWFAPIQAPPPATREGLSTPAHVRETCFSVNQGALLTEGPTKGCAFERALMVIALFSPLYSSSTALRAAPQPRRPHL